MDFPVEIMQQPDDAPQLFVLAEFLGIETHCRFDGQHVPHQVFILYVLMNDGECFFPLHGDPPVDLRGFFVCLIYFTFIRAED